MGLYVTQEKMEKKIGLKRLIQLTNDGNANTVEADVLADIIADGEAEVNIYLGKYNLPFTTVPPTIKRLTATVVTWLLYDRKPAVAMNEKVQKSYEAATKLLTLISKGDMTLGVMPEPAQNPGRAAVLEGRNRNFTRSTMGDF